jgi:adenylate kinase
MKERREDLQRIRAAFEKRQRELMLEGNLKVIQSGNEIIYDDGMLDQCGIGYYPPVADAEDERDM